jgi:diamine N-acetyltransferase
VTAQPSFRLATESDADTLLDFMRLYYAYDGHAFNGDKARTALVNLLRDPNLGLAWLIFDGETAVGYLVICFGYSLEWLGRDAFVDEFYLSEQYRGRGWGRKTIEFVEEASRKFGITALHLEVVRQNRTALQVYAKLGFKEHPSTLMSKWIVHEFAKPA